MYTRAHLVDYGVTNTKIIGLNPRKSTDCMFSKKYIRIKLIYLFRAVALLPVMSSNLCCCVGAGAVRYDHPAEEDST